MNLSQINVEGLKSSRSGRLELEIIDRLIVGARLALQLRFFLISESMSFHASEVMDNRIVN